MATLAFITSQSDSQTPSMIVSRTLYPGWSRRMSLPRGLLLLAQPSSKTLLLKQTKITTRAPVPLVNTVSSKVPRIESAYTSMRATIHLSYVSYRTEDKIGTLTFRTIPAAEKPHQKDTLDIKYKPKSILTNITHESYHNASQKGSIY